MSDSIWIGLVVAAAVLMVLYFGSRITRLVSSSSVPQIIALLIAVDVVTAAILTVAFADYWWLAATAGLAAAIGLAVLLMRTVAIRKSQTKSPVDNKMVSSQWHRLLWASIGMALIIAVIAGLSHSLIPLLLLVLPALSVLSGLAAVSLVSRGPHQNPPN